MKKLALGGGIGLGLLLMLPMFAFSADDNDPALSAVCTPVATPGHLNDPSLSPEQLKNANIIIKVGIGRRFSRRDIAIALATAMQESNLINMPGGDRDSIGLFQQRPSVKDGQGRPYWGTAQQIADPVYSTNRFYTELLKIKNRDQMSITQAAQAVQRSAYPNAYAKWEKQAVALANQGTSGSDTTFASATYSCVDAPQNTTGNTVPTQPGEWSLPIRGYTLGTPFGLKGSHWTATGYHTGQDFVAPIDTPIYAVGNAVVKMAEWGGSYGNETELQLSDGTVLLYAHQSRRDPSIQTGVSVKAGQLIGWVGVTGNTTGPHLHFEVRPHDGSIQEAIDPIPWLRSTGLKP